MDAYHFDLVTKISPEDEKTMPARGPERTKQMRIRLRALLAERFHLRIHLETREQPEYSLVMGNQGSKMKEGDPAQPPAGISSNCGVMKGTRTRMANLCVALSRQLERPVLDHTNLTGIYDFEMTYALENGCGSRQPDGTAPAAVSPLELPSLFTAIQEQLGLKLESIKGPVELIVIDGAEKPDPN
ncbi:MAG: TIGR03435 family protein [Bryobacteraceae bacterium]